MSGNSELSASASGSTASAPATSGGSDKRFIASKSDQQLSTADQSAAAAAAKGVTKLSLYPLDTWKSRCQAVYMSAYVKARDCLVAAGGGGMETFALAGIVAELTASVVRLPMEVSKLRLQLGLYRNTWHAFREFLGSPRSLYVNFVPQTILHDCTYSAVAWVVFESSRQQLFRWRGSRELPPYEDLALGTATGVVSAVLTNPLDVVKTRVVGQSVPQGASVARVALTILKQEGIGAFWRGCALRVMHLAPSHGLYMLLYEMAKRQLAAYKNATT